MGTILLTVRRAGWVIDEQEAEGMPIQTHAATGVRSKIQAVAAAKEMATAGAGATIRIETVKGAYKETVTLEPIGDAAAAAPDDGDDSAKKFGFGKK